MKEYFLHCEDYGEGLKYYYGKTKNLLKKFPEAIKSNLLYEFDDLQAMYSRFDVYDLINSQHNNIYDIVRV